MDVTINDEKMKKKGKEAKKIKTAKEMIVNKGEEVDEDSPRTLKSDGTYTHRPFELFFTKRKEEQESKK